MAATVPITLFRAMPTDAQSHWEPRATRLAAHIAFASFLISILTGLLLPIYTDEVGWRMHLRAAYDGGVDRMLNDICGPHTIVAPPLFMMPFRYLSAWANLTFPDPLYVRLLGVAMAIGWAFLLRALIGRIAVEPKLRARVSALAFALLGMGVLPIMLVMGRPDQVILLSMTAALMVAALAKRSDSANPRLAWLWPFLIVLLAIMAISWHLKGILVAPLFLACIVFSGRGSRSRPPRLLAALLLVACALQGANYWVNRFRCPDDPVLKTLLAQENLAAAIQAGGDWQVLVPAALHRALPLTYIALAESRPHMMSDWLPRDQISRPAMIKRFIVMNFAWHAAMLVSLICLVRALLRRWRERRIDLATVAPVILGGLVLVWGFSQQVKNDYEIKIVLPMLALFCVYSLSLARWSPRQGKWFGIAATLAVALSIAGQIDIAMRYMPPLARAAGRPGYVEGQRASVSVFGYHAIRGQILATAHMCGIGSHGRAVHPLLDDVTYFAMEDSWQPFHRLAVLENWKGSIRNPLAYLKSRGSDGLVMGCHLLSPDLRRQAIRNGEFCCIGTK